MSMLAKVREAVPVSFRRAVKIRRARTCESLGVYRYSMPALNQLDKQIMNYLPTGPGVFLEIGANDGFAQSNTYFLERARGWRGVLIEPLSELYESCRRVRPNSQCFNVACVGPDGPSELEIADLGLMSVARGLEGVGHESWRSGYTGPVRRVPTMTLSGILDAAHEPAVDFMSIDVEGAELHVLAGLDLNRHVPDLLLIETTKVEDVGRELDGRMELIEQLTHHDFVFRSVKP